MKSNYCIYKKTTKTKL